MHGSVFTQLERYVVAGHPAGTWEALLSRAGLRERTYDPLDNYPDEEMTRLVDAVVEASGASRQGILEDFGAALAPALLRMYWSLVDESWRTLDVLEHTEANIHRVVRLKHARAAPPALEMARTRPGEVILTYRSPRRLCALARGIARGIAGHYGERLEAEDLACVHRGDAECVIAFRVTEEAP
jgi:hypothetical protein